MSDTGCWKGEAIQHIPKRLPAPRLLAQRLQLSRQALALRLELHNTPAVPCPPAVVSEAEKGEGFWTPQTTFVAEPRPAVGQTR